MPLNPLKTKILLLILVLMLAINLKGRAETSEKAAMTRLEVMTYFKQAAELYQSNQISESVKILNQIRLDHPDITEVNNFLGFIYLTSNQLDSAEVILRNTYRYSPNNPEVLNNLAYLYLKRNVRPMEALVLARSAVETSPNDPSFRNTLAKCYAASRLYSETHEQFKASIKMTEAEIKSRYILDYADFLIEIKDYTNALIWLEQMRLKERTNISTLFRMLKIYENLGETVNAETTLYNLLGAFEHISETEKKSGEIEPIKLQLLCNFKTYLIETAINLAREDGIEVMLTDETGNKALVNINELARRGYLLESSLEFYRCPQTGLFLNGFLEHVSCDQHGYSTTLISKIPDIVKSYRHENTSICRTVQIMATLDAVRQTLEGQKLDKYRTEHLTDNYLPLFSLCPSHGGYGLNDTLEVVCSFHQNLFNRSKKPPDEGVAK